MSTLVRTDFSCLNAFHYGRSFFQVPPRQQTSKGPKDPKVNNGASPESKPASPMRGVSSPDLKLHHNRLLDSFHTQVGGLKSLRTSIYLES